MKLICQNKNSQIAGLECRVGSFVITFIYVNILIIFAAYLLRTVLPIDDFIDGEFIANCGIVFIEYISPIILLLLNVVIFKVTFGMKNMRIGFYNINGSRVGRIKCLYRVICSIFDIVLFPVAIILALIDSNRMTIADRMCKTIVCYNEREN